MIIQKKKIKIHFKLSFNPNQLMMMSQKMAYLPLLENWIKKLSMILNLFFTWHSHNIIIQNVIFLKLVLVELKSHEFWINTLIGPMIREQQVQADFSCEITSDKLDKIKIHESFEIRILMLFLVFQKIKLY